MRSSSSHCVTNLSSNVSLIFWFKRPVCPRICTNHIASLMRFLHTANFVLLTVGSWAHVVFFLWFIALLGWFRVFCWRFVDWLIQWFILNIGRLYLFGWFGYWLEILAVIVRSISFKRLIFIFFELRSWFSLLFDSYAMWA